MSEGNIGKVFVLLTDHTLTLLVTYSRDYRLRGIDCLRNQQAFPFKMVKSRWASSNNIIYRISKAAQQQYPELHIELSGTCSIQVKELIL